MNKMKIKEWVCSFSGCDGGNLYADTWLCGIEWGGGNLDNYYEEKLPKEIKNGKAPINLKEYSWEESLKYPYGRSFAKLFIAIKGGKVENYKDSARWNGEDLFKANLYPIAFESTDHTLWHKYGVDKITDFETKHLFNTWCFFNRFPFFTQLRIKHKPKLIICTGINYLRDYLMFFGGTNNINELHTGTIKPKSGSNKHDRSYYWVHLNNETLLVIIPFFSGRFGLNSNHLLQEMGDKIKILLGKV